jgi:hypothetical protein
VFGVAGVVEYYEHLFVGEDRAVERGLGVRGAGDAGWWYAEGVEESSDCVGGLHRGGGGVVAA